MTPVCWKLPVRVRGSLEEPERGEGSRHPDALHLRVSWQKSRCQWFSGDPPRSQLCWWWSWARPPFPARCPSGLGQGRPLLPSASGAQAKMPLFLNLRTMPGQHCSQRGQREQGWAESHTSWAGIPYPQTGVRGTLLAHRQGHRGSGFWSPPQPLSPTAGTSRPHQTGMDEAYLLYSSPQGGQS